METEPTNPPDIFTNYPLQDGRFITPTGVPVIFSAGCDDTDEMSRHKVEREQLEAEWTAIRRGDNVFGKEGLAPKNIQDIDEGDLAEVEGPDANEILFKHIEPSSIEESVEWFPYGSKTVSILHQELAGMYSQSL